MTARTSTRTHRTATTGQTGPQPRWLTYPEAAELCRLSVRSLITLNQIGTVTETLEAMRPCREAGYTQMVSHRSGETPDDFNADQCRGRINS